MRTTMALPSGARRRERARTIGLGLLLLPLLFDHSLSPAESSKDLARSVDHSSIDLGIASLRLGAHRTVQGHPGTGDPPLPSLPSSLPFRLALLVLCQFVVVDEIKTKERKPSRKQLLPKVRHRCRRATKSCKKPKHGDREANRSKR